VREKSLSLIRLWPCAPGRSPDFAAQSFPPLARPTCSADSRQLDVVRLVDELASSNRRSTGSWPCRHRRQLVAMPAPPTARGHAGTADSSWPCRHRRQLVAMPAPPTAHGRHSTRCRRLNIAAAGARPAGQQLVACRRSISRPCRHAALGNASARGPAAPLLDQVQLVARPAPPAARRATPAHCPCGSALGQFRARLGVFFGVHLCPVEYETGLLIRRSLVRAQVEEPKN
jgi:hypothetical protein